MPSAGLLAEGAQFISQDYFSDGVTEDVIAALGRFSNLFVAAKSAAKAGIHSLNYRAGLWPH